jgi:hypothetical protein
MCDPVTAALMATSAGATYAGNQKAQRKMEGAARAEKSRQKAFAEGQQNALDASINNRNYTNSQKSINDAKSVLQKDYTANDNGSSGFGVDAGAPEIAAGSDNQTVSDSYSRGESRAKTAANENATRTAALQAFGNTMQNQQLNNTRYAQDSAVLANMAQGSMGVLPYELQAAGHAGDSLKTIGQVLSLASLYSGYMNASGNPLGGTWDDLFGSAKDAGGGLGTAGAEISNNAMGFGSSSDVALGRNNALYGFKPVPNIMTPEIANTFNNNNAYLSSLNQLDAMQGAGRLGINYPVFPSQYPTEFSNLKIHK